MPVASSMMDLTQVFPELGMLTRAIGEENVEFVENLIEILAHRVGGVYPGEMSHTHIDSFLVIWQLQLL